MMQSSLPPGTSIMPLVKIAVIGRSGTYYTQVSLMSKFEIASDLGGSSCLSSLSVARGSLSALGIH